MSYRGKPVNIQGREPKTEVVTWAGATTSAAINMQGATAGLRLYLPAGFAGTAVTFTELTPAGDWVAVYRDGVIVTETIKAATAAWNVISAFGELFAADQIKIVSNQTETCKGYLRGAA